jgi:hypothetical protein
MNMITLLSNSNHKIEIGICFWIKRINDNKKYNKKFAKKRQPVIWGDTNQTQKAHKQSKTRKGKQDASDGKLQLETERGPVTRPGK